MTYSKTCPYSNATRGNIEIAVNVISAELVTERTNGDWPDHIQHLQP
jgi:hypothetical protein